MLTKESKKMLKKWAKNHIENKSIKPIKNVLIHRCEGDYDSENHTFLVKALGEFEAFKTLYSFYPVGGIEPPQSAYDCTGKPFADPAIFKQVAKNRWIVNLEIRYDV